jgi:uncharacterized membrane protein YfcA
MDLALWQYLLLTCAGVIAGWLNVMAGGGSMLTVPVMVFMGMPGPVANGTNRIAILAQNVSALATFFQRGFRDLKLGLSLSAAAIPGAIAGALIGVQLEGEWFDRVLALIMIGMMILMMTGGGSKKSTDQLPHQPSRRQLILGHICMVGAGFWGGFIQIGVGFILMPILHRVMGFDLVRVNFFKVFVVLIYTIVALIVFAANTEVVWVAGLALAAGNAIGGSLGARTTINKGENLIRWVLNAVLVLFIIKLLFF